jgi:hypothetical protein
MIWFGMPTGGHTEHMVPRVSWKTESTFSILLNISWLPRFENMNGEYFLQKLNSKTPLMFAKKKQV